MVNSLKIDRAYSVASLIGR